MGRRREQGNHGVEYTVISLFSGALGLDLGLEDAGFKIRVAVECNKFACDTIRSNRPELPLIPEPIEDVPTSRILEQAGLKPGEVTVVVGGPSCQSFSTAGARRSLGDPNGNLFQHFIRVVKDAQPRFFVMENVRGLLSAAVKHRPLNQRGPGFPALEPDEQLGSALVRILTELKGLGYTTTFAVLNSADYGVSQIRERVIFIGSRDGEEVQMPAPTHSKDGLDGLPKWKTLKEALSGLDVQSPTFKTIAPSRLPYISQIPEGGNWRDLPVDLQEKALGAAFHSWGGRKGFFRRLAWNRPCPALTTRPDSKATSLCHPTLDRPLSIEEYKRVQQFPDGWVFGGHMAQQYVQAGNAVPVGLGKAIGLAVIDAMKSGRKVAELGTVRCASETLLRALSKTPLTKLNPPRMRKAQTQGSQDAWSAFAVGKRSMILSDLLGTPDDSREPASSGV